MNRRYRMHEESVSLENALGSLLPQTLPHAVAVLQRDGRVLHVNRAWRQCPLGSVETGDSLFEAEVEAPKSRWEPSWAAVRHRLRTAVSGSSTDQEALDVRISGVEGESWHRIRLHFRGEGASERILLVLEEITHLKASEVRERELGEQLVATFESLSDGFILCDPSWGVRYLNAEAERFLGVSREHCLDAELWEALPPLALPEVKARLLELAEQERSDEFELQKPNGGRWFRLRTFPSTKGFAIYLTDVTELRSSQLKLAEQAALLNRTNDAILVFELEGPVLFWNRGAERLYGWSEAEAQSFGLGELLFEEPTRFEAIVENLELEGDWSGEQEHVSRDGQAVTVLGRWTVMRDSAGVPRTVLAIHTDITERKQFERQLLRAQRMESIGTLAGGMAHDLNNVLAPILVSLEILKEEVHSSSGLELLETMSQSAQRGADLVRQVLAFASGVQAHKVSLDPGQMVLEIQRIARETFPRNVVMEVKTEPGLWSVQGEPTQLHQVLMNLCVNARDAMPQGGTIRIELSNVLVDEVYARMDSDCVPGPYVSISVEDTGVGIAQEVQDKVFEPFFTTKAAGKGTGLGLSTVYSIVRSYGGSITVQSERGSGARFSLLLPAEGSAKTVEAQRTDSGELPRGEGELVLVVDDEESIRKATTASLERFGYRVLSAAHGAEAVLLYAERGREIQLVLTDMDMPIMDGPATIVALRSLDPQVRIIASSGTASNRSASRAESLGVGHFIFKPYTAHSMLRVFREVLEGPQQSSPP